LKIQYKITGLKNAQILKRVSKKIEEGKIVIVILRKIFGSAEIWSGTLLNDV
jgi:hypothetical protein